MDNGTATGTERIEPVLNTPGDGNWSAALGRQYLRVQLFWNPVLTGAAVLALGPGTSFWRPFAVSLVVAAVASSVCFVPVAVALAVQARAQRLARQKGADARAPRPVVYLALALVSLPLGLLLAAQITEVVFGVRAPNASLDYRFAAVLGGLLAAPFFLWQALSEARKNSLALELHLERAERHRLQAQLAALTAQLNPHLMFNALSTIAELVHESADRAERTVLRLSDLYRGVLRATVREQHSLEEELALCQAYLDIEQARFGDRLITHVHIAPGLDVQRVQVPVLVLEPLVENAVTHGLLDRARGGSVWISARVHDARLELEVRDDGIGMGQSGRTGWGIGIENTRQRLNLRYGQGAGLDLSSPAPGGTRARLHLPLQVS